MLHLFRWPALWPCPTDPLEVQGPLRLGNVLNGQTSVNLECPGFSVLLSSLISGTLTTSICRVHTIENVP